MANVCLPVLITAVATCVLIFRVFHQKRRMRQREMWRRNRHLVIQVGLVSLLYNIVWIPNVFCAVIVLFLPNPSISEISNSYLFYYQYIPVLFYPFLCLMGLPEVRDSLKKRFECKRKNRRTNTVQPAHIFPPTNAIRPTNKVQPINPT